MTSSKVAGQAGEPGPAAARARGDSPPSAAGDPAESPPSSREPTTRQPWHLDKGRRAGEMGYLPGLDGIRAVAVLGVLLYHGDLTWMRGGYLGVDVFFVLSGFLITTLIAEEYQRTGGINFKKFYLGRARRLLPALLLMLGVVGFVVAVFYRDSAAVFRADAIASLFYVTNWWYIFTDASYFEAIGRPPMLQHLWSLAVEEQFYLIWPLIALLLLRWRNRAGVFWVALIGSLLSTAWMAILAVTNGYPEEADPSRAYFGADSHVMGLLLGAALAMIWRPGRLPTRIAGGAKAIITAVGVLALVTILWFYWQVGEFSPFIYRGGFFVLSVTVCLLIAAATHPAVSLGAILGAQPMRYIGQRSYGLYLWHWPIFAITRPNLDIPLDGAANFVLRMALTFAVAELSYRFVEIPIRRGAIGNYLQRWREADPDERARMSRAVVSGAAVSIAALGIVGFGLATAPAADQQIPDDVAAAIGIDDGGPTSILVDEQAADDTAASPSPSPTFTGPAVLRSNRNGTVTAIGDSVLLGVAQYMQDTIDGAQIDAEVSRQADAVRARIEKLADKDFLAPNVVIHTGTNGIITEEDLRAILDLLSDRDRVVVVNTRVPERWAEPNNELIAAVVPDYPNAVIADWASASADHPEYFVSDGTHPQWPDGIQAFVAEIARALGLSA